MLGIHAFKYVKDRVFSTKNKKITSSSSAVFGFEDYDLIIQYLSALNWKKYNGPIYLYTASSDYSKFEKLKMLHLYDYVNTTVLDKNSNYTIDNNIFWASSKIELISEMTCPFTILDLDLYVEKDLNSAGFFTQDLGLLHFEDISLTYPYPRTMPGYNMPDWNWNSYPVNAALVYFKNSDFTSKYAEHSLRYMHNNTGKYVMDNLNSRMVFAEQRLLGECIVQYQQSFVNIIDGLYYPTLDNDNCYGFTDVMNLTTAYFKETDEPGLHYHSNIKETEHYVSHLWGFKMKLLNDKMLRIKFVSRLLEKFLKDFPNQYDNLISSLEILYQTVNKNND